VTQRFVCVIPSAVEESLPARNVYLIDERSLDPFDFAQGKTFARDDNAVIKRPRL